MKKEDFINGCKKAIEENKGIIVYVEISGNKNKEMITNTAEDVENKMNYYDKIYDENMEHIHAPVKIVGLLIFNVQNNFDIKGIIK